MVIVFAGMRWSQKENGAMRRTICLLCVLALLTAKAGEKGRTSITETRVIGTQRSEFRWEAGATVDLSAAENYGIDRLFVAEEISDSLFRAMRGKSYKADCSLARSELRHIRVLHYDGHGAVRMGELVANKSIAAELVEIFHRLFDGRYPIERMLLIDRYEADDERSMADNNSSCFNFRRVRGSKRLSKHCRGLAIDINPLYNPCVRRRSNGTLRIEPAAGNAYADRKKKSAYMIERGDLCYRLFRQHGFRWGGDWKSAKDYQHFEK